MQASQGFESAPGLEPPIFYLLGKSAHHQANVVTLKALTDLLCVCSYLCEVQNWTFKGVYETQNVIFDGTGPEKALCQ